MLPNYFHITLPRMAVANGDPEASENSFKLVLPGSIASIHVQQPVRPTAML
jgi:hypothetical protein